MKAKPRRPSRSLRRQVDCWHTRRARSESYDGSERGNAEIASSRRSLPNIPPVWLARAARGCREPRLPAPPIRYSVSRIVIGPGEHGRVVRQAIE